ncbi:hypothetical protein GIB67_035996 [Kingdonia uniflora]|uniref:glutamine--tRNA ligase n=1 Tax=Kingdonia uniflora TaxID=39325 RepID=A0A7J7N0T5_9MAGN|nr:hypothetical protein GIB67_035996 [Kingdonia uniflora]
MVGKEELDEKSLELFLKIGLDTKTAKNTVANRKLTTNLTAVINEAGVLDGCSRSVGNLLYLVAATKFPSNALVHRPALLPYIVSSKIKSTAQLEAAFKFLGDIGPDKLDLNELEEACGVGINVFLEEIELAVTKVLEENMESIMEKQHGTDVWYLCSKVKEIYLWADRTIVKKVMDEKLLGLLGEKPVEEKSVKKKKEKLVKVEDQVNVLGKGSMSISEEEMNSLAISPFPEENFPHPEKNLKVHTEIFFSDGAILRVCNTKEMLEKHLKATGAKFFSRFPPEPNGYLHIGHAKALFVSFGLAKEKDGCCYLRFDDTNPEAEKKEYIDHIKEIVEWMGWKPFKITYTSDYFQDLYNLAVELIRRGHAYVDHQSSEEVKEYREKKMNSPWRDRPVAESLKLFDEMRMGMIEEGKATLRMKQDMQSDNYNMYDLIAYRIKAIPCLFFFQFTPHPHSGDKWCIYPSYDFSHCIVDSLENITHSLCTLEFETRRASYYWLLDVLGLYKPYVWEYSRLNVTNTVMSKRKLNRLVTENWVDGWDDPRLMTLAGLRRRGVSSTSINAFVRGIGITRSDCSMIRLDRLEYHVREELNKLAPRTMVVLNPLKVVITNLDSTSVIDRDAKKWPDAQSNDPDNFYKVPFTSVVYIERSDFRLKDSKDYYGLAPGKSVMLRWAFPIKCTEVLHWVAQPSPGTNPLKVEVRLFEKLFLSENPAELDDWLGDLNPQSKEVISEAVAVPSLASAKVGDTFQFERLGYFAVDPDSTADKLVFNRTVTLRDSYSKGGKR